MNSELVCVLVDDDTDDRDIFGMALRDVSDSFRLVEATGAEEALRLFNDRSFIPSYIFLDLNMPRMSGTECLQELRKHAHLRLVPVIIYSTSSADRDRHAAQLAGAQYFFTKPASLVNLTRQLREIIAPARLSSYHGLS